MTGRRPTANFVQTSALPTIAIVPSTPVNIPVRNTTFIQGSATGRRREVIEPTNHSTPVIRGSATGRRREVLEALNLTDSINKVYLDHTEKSNPLNFSIHHQRPYIVPSVHSGSLPTLPQLSEDCDMSDESSVVFYTHTGDNYWDPIVID